jgi:hypothetical protein
MSTACVVIAAASGGAPGEVTTLELERWLGVAGDSMLCGFLGSESAGTTDPGGYEATLTRTFQVDECSAWASAWQRSEILPDGVEFHGRGSAAFGPPVGTSVGWAVSGLRLVFRVDRVTDCLITGTGSGVSWVTNFVSLTGEGVSLDASTAAEVDLSARLAPGVYTFEIEVGSELDLTGQFDGALVFTPPGCNPADLAEPFGLLDQADVDAFIAGFHALAPLADLAAPEGLFDLGDITAFVAAFVDGCPTR